MIERVGLGSGVVVWRSPLLAGAGVAHGFSTRLGGTSEGAFAAMNLGNPAGCAVQDREPTIEENYRLLQGALGGRDLPRAWVHQVHGSAVAVLAAEPEGEYSEGLAAGVRDRFNGQTEADGLFTAESGVWLAIRVADCVPVLLASTGQRKMAAAVHAGWRGAVGGVVANAVREFRERGVGGEELIAAIGPHICVRDFEVGPEVAEAFVRAGMGEAVMRGEKPDGKAHVDLQRAIVGQLRGLGVTRVDRTDQCSVEDAGDFFSHRRENGVTGRMAALIRV